MRLVRDSRRLAVAGVALASFVLLSPVSSPSTRPTSGRGSVGEWDLAWRISAGEGLQNLFRLLLGDEIVFPVRWIRLVDSSGSRLLLFGPDGEIRREVPLSAGQDGMAAEDGRSFVLWTEDPTTAGLSSFAFHRADAIEPDWTATARGVPVLMAHDGGLFVIASETGGVHVGTATRGSLEIVGAQGEVRGELPIFPEYSTMSGDGQRVLFLRNGELTALGRDGNVHWRRRVPIDQIRRRTGTNQLAAAGDVIVVAGTGVSPAWNDGGIHPDRRGVIQVYDVLGSLVWERKQAREDDLWFQLGVVLSPDGENLATYHLGAREIQVRLFRAKTGDLLWTQSIRRQTGSRCLGMADGGDLVVLAHGDAQTSVLAWDREGRVAWDGLLPFTAREIRVAGHDLLVAERWIVRLRRPVD